MYTIYQNKLEALTVNAQEAFNRGCNMETTIEWFARVNHPDGRSALANDGPVTVDEMLADGWPIQTTV